ncbi:MAG TPA: hypothetical protein PL124_10785 [Candidatus Cloacimonadota bacterium]|nr:hypothetical protein [Candidatus Cloacimonadota bacterium]HPS39889.1 hypothetical protein [Candidatus Cloacimonadota bacterium]
MPKAEFDEQGKLFWHLAMAAGWDQMRVDKYLLKRFSATHWNALDSGQKRQAISTMRIYAKKNEKTKCVKWRQTIMGLVATNGHDLDWLHTNMEVWGFKPSLRALTLWEITQLYDTLKGLFPGRTPGGDSQVIEDGVSYEYDKLKGNKTELKSKRGRK